MSDFDGLCGNADNLLDENYSFEHAFEAEFPLSESLVIHIHPDSFNTSFQASKLF